MHGRPQDQDSAIASSQSMNDRILIAVGKLEAVVEQLKALLVEAGSEGGEVDGDAGA